MVKDPICGMTVEETTSLHAERDGQTFYFCSEHCRKTFLSTPATAKLEEMPQGKTKYTCPMHPEVLQDHPGSCPKCGMALEPMTASAGTDDGENAELQDMTRRFGIGAALALPVFVLAMAHMQSAGITLVKGDLRGIAQAIRLSRATMRNIRQNLVFAFLYNALGIPIVAGVLYPFFGLLLSPIIAGAAMSLSSVSVISNALRLRHAKL